MTARSNAALPPDGPDLYERIALTLGEQGWCVTDAFLAPIHVSQLRHEAEQLWRKGAFRRAGVGRGSELTVRPEVRTDHVRWIDPQGCSGAQRLYLDALERLRQAVNRTLFLGLMDFEGHLAVYPPGTYYRRHLDQFRGIELRTLTAILYLNDAWCESDGGALRICTDPDDPDHHERVLPIGGRLVTFLSARFMHEVLPASRDRISVTGWFRRRE